MTDNTHLTTVLEALSRRQDLSTDQMSAAMRSIMTGQATAAQIGGFLMSLRSKGETVTEITAAARIMRELSSKVAVEHPNLVDTCGTGGDASGTFNISTVSAIVAAAAGAQVAKHGNRSVSSRSGSADVLAAAGVNIELSPTQVAACIQQCGLGFMFAPLHHSAMRHAIGPRRELGVRTIFNVLGPLTNPADAKQQILGVFARQWVQPLAEVLQALGSEHVMVVHAEDGLDEISIAAPTLVAELRAGQIQTYAIEPEQFGLQRATLDAVRADSAAASLAIIQNLLLQPQQAPAPVRDIVLLNAGAAIYVSGIASNLATGVDHARKALLNGAAQQTLEHLIECSHQS